MNAGCVPEGWTAASDGVRFRRMSILPRTIRCAALIWSSALAACLPDRLEKTETDLQAAISEALTRGDTATVRLFLEVPFAFDRLYIAGPRTPERAIADAFKSDEWVPEMSRQIESSDHFHLLVFETRGKLVPAALPKRVAELAPELIGRMYTPDDAVFRVSRPAGAAVPLLSAR